MKLLICVVNNDDAYRLLDALMREGHDATLVSTTGGLLREGNATLLIGVEDKDLDRVIEIVQLKCHSRTRYITPFPPLETEELYMPPPIEVPVSGAVVFVLDIERSERF